MRELKFRAFDISKKIMVYSGDFYHWAKLNEWELKGKVYPCEVTSHGISYTTRISEAQANDYVELTKDGERSTYYRDWECEQLYSNNIELMQYTGLKDKNNKDIYEGDIVLYGNEKYLIKIDDYKFYAEGFYAPHQDDPCDIFSECAYKSCEVIGNVYKNPKLLEK